MKAAPPVARADASTGTSVRCVGVVHVYNVFGIDVAALRGVDLHVEPAEHVGLFGPSGSGKSTLLSVVSGFRQPSAGRILIDGEDIARAKEARLRNLRKETISVLLQGASSNLLDYLSATDNVAYAQRGASGDRSLSDPRSLLAEVGLAKDQARRPVKDLSTGQQHAVALAVAVAKSPRLLLADEPTSQLPPDEAGALLDAILRIARLSRTTLLIVTHDPKVTARMDRTLHLREGRIGAEESGSAERLAVVGTDGSLHLPEQITEHWTAGTRVRITETGHDTLEVKRIDDAAPLGRQEQP